MNWVNAHQSLYFTSEELEPDLEEGEAEIGGVADEDEDEDGVADEDEDGVADEDEDCVADEDDVADGENADNEGTDPILGLRGM